MSLWAITSYFNPEGYGRRLHNYRAFRQHLAAPLLTVQLAGGPRPGLDEDDADILVTCTDGDVMWQKERLLNCALKHLPSACREVAWIDCDVIFDDDSWVAGTARALEAAPLVQLFGELRHAPRDAAPSALRGSRLGAVQPSLAASREHAADTRALLRSGLSRAPGAPSAGIAWAARREWLAAHGLYDRCIVGGGDTALVCAALGHPEMLTELHRMNAAQRLAYLGWATGITASVAGRIGHVPGTVHHLWHGELAHRHTAERHAALVPLGFDPVLDLAPGRDGAWRWARDNPALHHWVRGFFATRREDG